MNLTVGIFVPFVFFFIFAILYFKLGLFRRFYHDIMGWHTPDYSKGVQIDPVNIHATCKYCGREIMQDSQGNWFVS